MSDSDAVTVRRRRLIPNTAKILVNPGEAVMPDTIIARTEALPGKLWRVDVTQGLGIDPSAISGRLLMKPGDRVQAEDILGVGGAFFDRRAVRSPVKGTVALVSRSRGLAYVREDVDTGSQEEAVEVPVAEILGISPVMIMVYKAAEANVGEYAVKGQTLARFGKRVAASPMYGKISAISPTKGTITVQPLFRSQATMAYLKGQVSEVVAGEAVEIVGRARVVAGIWGLGGESCGSLQILDGDLTGNTALPPGSVVAARGTATCEGLVHAAESGVKGVILGWLGSAAVSRFAGALKNMGVTGDESVPFPLILVEGFLACSMRSDSFDVLKACEGCLCSVKGVTHIRAGVVRPEILIFPD